MDNLLPEALDRLAHCHRPAALTHLRQLEAESIDINRTRVTMCWRQLQPLLARKGGSLLRQIQPLSSNPEKPFLESLRRIPTLRFFRRFVSELAPDGIVATVVTGLVALILVVVESLSYAALIFSRPLSRFIGVGIAITLNTAVVVGLITAVFGSYPGAIAFSQNKIAALIAFMTAALTSSMANSLPARRRRLPSRLRSLFRPLSPEPHWRASQHSDWAHSYVLFPIQLSVDFWPRSAGCFAWVPLRRWPASQ
jgi:hypothetical protein